MAKEGIPSALLHDDEDKDEDDFELKSFEKASTLSARPYPGTNSESCGVRGTVLGAQSKGNQRSGHKRQRKMEAMFLCVLCVSRVSIC